MKSRPSQSGSHEKESEGKIEKVTEQAYRRNNQFTRGGHQTATFLGERNSGMLTITVETINSLPLEGILVGISICVCVCEHLCD